MDITCDIEEIERCAGKMAACYSKKAIFGRNTDKDLFDIIRVVSYVKILRRNKVKYRQVTVNSPLPQTVDFSSLVSQNNMLILPASTSSTECVKVESCLSEDEICSIIESAKILCSQFNC